MGDAHHLEEAFASQSDVPGPALREERVCHL